ncbi:hypothetical protein RHOER0001_3046 [Rhodococcus erythropolis SK121]|nr:hypothetical protein RHOER0001_3046 [Rhodococcus erythropolis SK121]
MAMPHVTIFLSIRLESKHLLIVNRERDIVNIEIRHTWRKP